MGFLFGGPKIPAPAVVPPPPNPPTMADASVAQSGAAAANIAAAAAGGMGFGGTVQSGAQGASAPVVAQKALLGS